VVILSGGKEEGSFSFEMTLVGIVGFGDSHAKELRTATPKKQRCIAVGLRFRRFLFIVTFEALRHRIKRQETRSPDFA
jgi:hypothetical protein